LSTNVAWSDVPPRAADGAAPSAPVGTAATSPATSQSTPPEPSTQHLEKGQHFAVDPIADGVLIAGGAGFAGLLSLVLQTGEIKATLPGPTRNLLSFDRGAVTQTIDPNANTYSDIGLYLSVAFAAVDPILSGVRDGWDAGLVDAVMYAETIALTETLTDITKIAVRRPRPIDYLNCDQTTSQANQTSDTCLGTNNNLSFFSGHAATVGAISATATYLAFVRSPGSARAWATLGAGILLTTLVSYERVRGGDHFPTDVVAGSMAGAAVGVIVPHLHRHQEEAPSMLVGAAPTPGGATVALTASF
jgi:undecaprenyl-diphosphatase